MQVPVLQPLRCSLAGFEGQEPCAAGSRAEVRVGLEKEARQEAEARAKEAGAEADARVAREKAAREEGRPLPGRIARGGRQTQRVHIVTPCTTLTSPPGQQLSSRLLGQ